MEQLNFRTSSGIKSIVGKDLITDKFVAIFELVKNGYDAGAKEIIVSFNNMDYLEENPFSEKRKKNQNLLTIDDNEPHIVIADNGHGMSKDDLINKWLYLAYSDKQEGSKNEERVFVGSKGIGRFSCDTLGAVLNIRTKKANENIEHLLVVDWSSFEQNISKEFEKIKVHYESNAINNKNHYTILTIGHLRNNSWKNKDEQKRAKRSLERLKNPFIDDKNFNIYLGENLSLDKPDSQSKVYNEIAEVLKGRTTTVEAIIDHDIKIKLHDRGELIYEVSKSNETILNNISIHILINYLNTSAKTMFTKRMKVTPGQYGNVFVYRNSFRVMPYGEEYQDLFGLNLRKAQGYNRYIGTREIIGYIAIEDKNNFFKEASSRDNGFIENSYFKTLENIYLSDIHTLLEHYVRLIQWGESSETNEEIFFNSDLDSGEINKYKKYIQGKKFNIDFFKEDLDIDKNNTEKQLDKIIATTDDENTKKVAKKAKEKISNLTESKKRNEEIILNKEREVENLQKQNENLQKIRASSSYAEQISHHFKSMADDLYYATEDLIDISNKIEKLTLKNVLLEKISDIRSTQRELEIFRMLLINTDLDMRSNQTVNWFDQSLFFTKHKNKDSHSMIVTCSIMNDEYRENWNKECSVLQFQMTLDNFYYNAKEHNGSYLNILFENDRIIFSSNSKKIEEIHLKKIFELGYSTKPNGTGIGLHQIKSFFDEIDFDISIDQTKGEVSFIVEKRK